MRSDVVAFALPALVLGLWVGTARAQFVTGNVYSGANGAPYGARDITAGGDVSASALLLATPGRNSGQLAFSPALDYLYATQFDLDEVVAVDAGGNVSSFATGINGPTGLAVLSDGRMLVVSFYDHALLDITAGGDFTNAVPFATGLSGGRNLLQLGDGRVLVADQGTGAVYDVHYPNGGVITPAENTFATGLGLIGDLVETSAGHIYLSRYGSNQIMDITLGGDFFAVSPFATGRQFMGLTEDGGGRLLASQLGGTNVYDVTAGGDFSAASAWAVGNSYGESALDTVPGLGDGQPCNDPLQCARHQCVDGVCCDSACGGGDVNDCQACSTAAGAAADGVCGPSTGNPCSDGVYCNGAETCTNGACGGSAGAPCSASIADGDDDCGEACDEQAQSCTAVEPDGTACDDGDGCTQTDSCSAGTCVASDPLGCSALDECHNAGECNPSTGECSNPEKADDSPCPGGTCQAGACVPGGAGGGGAGGSGTGGGGAGGSATGGDGGNGNVLAAGAPVEETGGCGCRLGARTTKPSRPGLLALAGLGATLARRRRPASGRVRIGA
jgi:MYXO-CTERM domain-containing protein